MTYNKPTIEVLGEAVGVIQGSTSKINIQYPDLYIPEQPIFPAYDLDE